MYILGICYIIILTLQFSLYTPSRRSKSKSITPLILNTGQRGSCHLHGTTALPPEKPYLVPTETQSRSPERETNLLPLKRIEQSLLGHRPDTWPLYRLRHRGSSTWFWAEDTLQVVTFVTVKQTTYDCLDTSYSIRLCSRTQSRVLLSLYDQRPCLGFKCWPRKPPN